MPPFLTEKSLATSRSITSRWVSASNAATAILVVTLLVTLLTINPTATGPALGATATTRKPASTAAKSTKVGAATTVARVGAGKSKIVQPGKEFVGWDLRKPGDWPDADSAMVLEPIAKSILVRKSPDYSTPGILLASGTSVSGNLGLLVVGSSPGWWKVLLPVRPNGTVGWVEASSVNARLVRERLVVDLSTNTLTLMVDGKAERTESVATGTSGTPTPAGLFFVKSIVPQANPAGGRGPYVLVLSAFSNVLNSFDGGQGAVGIHGTSAPGKLGQDVSHGCVRTRNDTITFFAKNLRTGTPVEIHDSPKHAPKDRWATPDEVKQAPGGLIRASSSATGGSSAAAGKTGVGQPTSTTAAGQDDKVPTQPTTTVADGVGSAKPPITGISE